MKLAVFDLECNGLKPDKIYCVSVHVGDKLDSTVDYERMKKLFSREDFVFIAHNGIRFDIPVLERILGIEVKAKVVDTLALSWYLEPSRMFHGLAEYGEDFGVPKPPIEDWDNLPIEDYIHRCEEDVKINVRLWKQQWKQLNRLYGSEEAVWRLIDYLTFKMQCARDQEKYRWKLDVEKCKTTLAKLVALKEVKVVELTEAMPKVPEKVKRNKPAKPFKKNGELSETGKKWFSLLEQHGLEKDYDGVVEEVVGWIEPNPGSHDQIKKWLYDLGWEPQTFEFKRNKQTGDIRQIPQVSLKHGAGLCPSVKRLYEQEPKLEVLEGLSILTHRISLLEGFLNNADDEGYVQAQVQGLTNTLRFKHRVVVNLPGIDKPYGSDIRGCLCAPEGYELVGSDMSSLEDRTKQHFMWPYDPEYVKEMMTPDFDPHIDLAVQCKLMSLADANKYKQADKEFEHSALYKALKKVRAVGKKVNYTAVYGAGDAAVARAAEVPLAEGAKLRESYWKRNWAVLKIAEDQTVKVCNGMKWLYNPVSKLWYSLRFEKDRFSTLNQGTGVWCFDTWVKHLRNGGPPIIGQMHDEVIGLVRKAAGVQDRAERHFKNAIRKTNEELKLNRELDCSVQFGSDYAQIH